MTCRTAERIVTWALLATAACSGDNTGPSAPTCSSALASQLTLAVGAYASIDPATDGGCVAFPANASAVDSAEYLLVPQSAAPTFGGRRRSRSARRHWALRRCSWLRLWLSPQARRRPPVGSAGCCAACGPSTQSAR